MTDRPDHAGTRRALSIIAAFTSAAEAVGSSPNRMVATPPAIGEA